MPKPSGTSIITLTAAGNTQANAATIITSSQRVVVLVAMPTGGGASVRLPDAPQVGDEVYLIGAGGGGPGEGFQLWPEVGASIDSCPVNASINVGQFQRLNFMFIGSNRWVTTTGPGDSCS